MSTLLLMLTLLLPQEPLERRAEDLPDGRRVEWDVVATDAGDVRHGTWRALDPDGAPAIEGGYEDGRRSGRWTWFHPNGTPRETGVYRDDQRIGRWQLSHADGARAGQGRYARGRRDGRWTFWTVDGEVDALESGEYAWSREAWPEHERRTRAEGALLDGERHGTWTHYWEDGKTVQLTGSWQRGRRHGTFVFRHPDGSPAPRFVSGVYADDAFLRELERGELEALGLELGAAPDLGVLEPAAELAWFPRLRAEAARETVVAYLAGRVDLAQVTLAFAEDGHAVLPTLIGLLRDLGAADPAHAEAARAKAARIALEVLPSVCGGHGLGWSGHASPVAIAADREVIREWHTLWRLVADNEEFWTLDLRDGRPDGRRSATLARPPLGHEGVPSPPDVWARRLLSRDDKVERKGRLGASTEGRDALDAALLWLARAQRPDGRWDSAAHGAEAGHDVGLTALAALAFLGDGDTSRVGPYSSVVARAIAWLLEHQDPLGCIRLQRAPATQVYDHAIATVALAEAAAFSRNARIAEALERAASWIARAQRPDSGWRYDRTGSDTSVTAWMVTALWSAEQTGHALPPACRTGATAWFDQVTEPTTGRAGYDVAGSFSARIKDVNHEYPVDVAEAMSAAALLGRVLLATEEDDAIRAGYVALVLDRLPDPSDERSDRYYWFWATQALFQVGGNAWSAWADAFAPVALETQVPDGPQAGSWEPVGPWGMIGGRVYATAMMALSLEAPWRTARLAE